MIRRPPRSTLSSSSAASDVYKRQTESARSAGSECYKSSDDCQSSNNEHWREIDYSTTTKNHQENSTKNSSGRTSMSDRASKNNESMARTKQTDRKRLNGDSDRESKKPSPEKKLSPATKKTRKQSDKKYGDFVCPTCSIHFNQASNRKRHMAIAHEEACLLYTSPSPRD